MLFTSDSPCFFVIFNTPALDSLTFKVWIKFLTTGLNCHLSKSRDKSPNDFSSEINQLLRDSTTTL